MPSIRVSNLSYIPAMPYLLSGQMCYLHVDVGYEDVGAMRFNADDEQYVRIPTAVQYDNLKEFTITTWLRFNSGPSGDEMAVLERENGFWFYTSESLREVITNIRPLSGATHTRQAPTYTIGKWHNYTITYDGTNLKYYFDGAVYRTTSVSGMTLGGTGKDITLGYDPTYGYGSFDQALFRIYNYALEQEEIETFSGRCITRSQLCYIQITDGLGHIDNSNWAYIYCPISSTNPGIWNESIVLAFGVDAHEADPQPCYVHSEQTITTFDNVISIDNHQYTNFDSVIIVQGRSDAIQDITVGQIEYPITRRALLWVDFLTRYNPGVEESILNVWLQTHFEETLTQPAFIKVNEFAGGYRSVFLNGHYLPIDSSLGCHIYNQVANGSQAAFIEGFEYDAFDIFKYAFIMGAGSNLSNSTDCYIEGGGTVIPTKLSYISGPHQASDFIPAHIVSAFEIRDSHVRMNMHGHGTKASVISAHTFGHYFDEPSNDCYICVNEMAEDSLGLFINCPHAHVSRVGSYIYNLATGTSSVLCYLKADRLSTSLQAAFINGWNARRSRQNAFVAAPLFDISATNHCYVVNNNPQSSVGAYIVCGPQSKVRAYLVSYGIKESVQFASIT